MAGRRLSRYQQSRLDAAFARADREAALRKQGGRCAYCLVPLDFKTVTRDHVKPRAAGGLDHRNNIVAACTSCNRHKGHMPYGTFIKLITEPQPGDPIMFRLIWASRRINKRLMQMEDTLMRAVGRK